ncbi:DUF3040 domain-containing protein [Mobilicoccus massiliensis]|uniref:DUF3040 domain-containing protein n=1 Tax=Mobilicoccus massiliensis TaxID=1522310 RepID=UPI00058AFBDE|nr:DUF3040 domain-containing protein [Mobilicoccus massiliensis]
MPLSEHEQKLLEQMERALYAEDPKFASQMKGKRRGGPPRKRLITGLCIALVGLALIVAGVSQKLIWLGGAGFAVMVAGVAWAFGAGGRTLTDTSTGRSRRTGRGRTPKTRGGSSSFMQRMENRWDERKRGDAY